MMRKSTNFLTRIIQKNNFIKNKLFSIVFQYLLTNRNDAEYFVKIISDDLRSKNKNKEPNFKFTPNEEERYNWIKGLNINTILDIGAWKGDSAVKFHSLFPEAKIYSFEPLKDCFEQLNLLSRKMSELKPFNFALGDQPSKMMMNRSSFSPSSSLLKMLATHKTFFPFSADESVEEIEVRTLDSVCNEIELKHNVLLKIDVQGYEENVLNGALDTLKKIKIIIVELAFVQLYQGQPRFDKIYKLLSDHGFDYAGSWRQSMSPVDGQVLQQDAIFISKL